ncbi:MAG: hypothetical protein WD036_05655 [Bauldia sp.]
MKHFGRASLIVGLLWLASPASAECNRPEYIGTENFWIGHCNDLGVSELACRDQFATAKAELDWVLFENPAALEAYRASVKEQIACGFPPILLTYVRAAAVAVKARDPQAQCLILLCPQKPSFYMQDLEDQGKLLKE